MKLYVELGGKEGHLAAWPTLLLITRRNKSGPARRTELIYGRDGDNYVVMASYAGAPTHPDWYLNLVADPEVVIQM